VWKKHHLAGPGQPLRKCLRPEWSYPVTIGDNTGSGVAYDTPILGYGVSTANTLRLWSPRAPEAFDFGPFKNAGRDSPGRFCRRCSRKRSRRCSIPMTEMEQGTVRLSQQIFFVKLQLQELFRIPPRGRGWRVYRTIHTKFAVQLNDTHPAIAVGG